jgi:caspase domain-containing protein
MAQPTSPEARYHVLLIGIDDYGPKSLRGCVNDIDAVQRLLLKRAKLPKESVRRLASPLSGAKHDTSLPEEPATLDNLRAALGELGTKKVQAGDRVFIYYSGHGARAICDDDEGLRFHREALVPADVCAEPGKARLLYDFELNALLAAIAERTRAVTFVLDCCHSTGATRWGADHVDLAARSFDVKAALLRTAPLPGSTTTRERGVRREPTFEAPTRGGQRGLTVEAPTRGAQRGLTVEAPTRGGQRGLVFETAMGDQRNPAPEVARGPLRGLTLGVAKDGKRGLARGVDDCLVVSACLNHELAYEAKGPGNLHHGFFTRAFLSALAGVPDDALRSTPWGHIWQAMRAEVETQNAGQHLWMSGHDARAVLGGPPLDGDRGLDVERTGPNDYRIGAGELAGITKGARVAVYGDRPPVFPKLNSDADREARFSPVLLKVTRAELASATAEAEGKPFDLPPGARGRLVQPGALDQLRCAVVATTDLRNAKALTAQLAASPLLEVVDADRAQVRLEERDDGTWVLTDDVHSAVGGRPALFTLRRGKLDRARAVLEHYYHYALPLRMAKRCVDSPGALEISLLACPPERDLTPDEAQAANLREAPAGGELSYDLKTGAKVAVCVRNTSNLRLRVFLVNAATHGKVQVLGDQVIDAESFYVFWARNTLGVPFTVKLQAGVTQGIDRMVAVGTTDLARNVGHLCLDATFADIVGRADAQPKLFDEGEVKSLFVDRWTATEIVVRTSD